MAAKRTPQRQAKAPSRPRLVLISDSEPEHDETGSQPVGAPLRIVGTEPRASGGFRLTDR
jgi:hypothetical protein